MKAPFLESPTEETIIAQVRSDHQDLRGKVIQLPEVFGYVDEDLRHFHLEPPATFRVLESDDKSLVHWNDKWCDPYWDLELVSTHPELTGVRSFFCHGHSYQLGSGRTDRTRLAIQPEPALPAEQLAPLS